MNSQEAAGDELLDHTDEEASDDAAARSDAEAVDTDTEPLQRSQEAIDKGRDAAQSALKDTVAEDEEPND
jgi:hypothetical protein